MHRAIALCHVAFEDLGLIAPELDAAGYAVETVAAPLAPWGDPGFAASLQEADLVVVLGGPIGVYETDVYPFLKGELAAIAARLQAGRAVLGICLGAQLMAAALGAKVYPGGIKEIGWGKVSVTGEGQASVLAPLDDEAARVLHWHGDTFDLPLGDTPFRAVRLISNENYPNQAFAYGPSLGLQFHLEADPAKIENWLVGHALELAKAGIDIAALRTETGRLADRVKAQAQAVFGAYLKTL
jgi:GMP synthase - Glutamine amidotransferase domain